MRANILLIYTGGTIGMIKNAQSEALQAFNFEHLLKSIPELKLLNCSIDAVSFDTPIDSSNMNPLHWIHLAKTIENKYKSEIELAEEVTDSILAFVISLN